ncbi:ubiquinone biosynthesis methyltransferase UbiE [Haloprofundus marisrubri]|uniref:Ubiquinone biosynthesis methyltransferase UbiE n=1 Tax=Haloprofundus marisrubri TaxID=1514971 RepID=A0A0W1R9K4_9EURY|nr:class I SAM-dependent methyltransferase [Haloprofundus marisrubri]KTG10049.1 ubiquinone biosynthesis methyltransferase UbiE [Haloprofundus marisrubri]
MDDVSGTLDAYERNAESFVEKYRSESIAARFGDEFRAALPGKRVLDVGCGPGADSETFSAAGYDVTGIDLTPSFVESAHESVPAASFVRGDMRELPFRDETFDGVWSCASFHHVGRSDAPGILREFERVLAPDGVVYLSVKRGEKSGCDADGRYFERYLAEDVRSLLTDARFDPRSVDGRERWVSAVAVSPGGR